MSALSLSKLNLSRLFQKGKMTGQIIILDHFEFDLITAIRRGVHE